MNYNKPYGFEFLLRVTLKSLHLCSSTSNKSDFLSRGCKACLRVPLLAFYSYESHYKRIFGRITFQSKYSNQYIAVSERQISILFIT